VLIRQPVESFWGGLKDCTYNQFSGSRSPAGNRVGFGQARIYGGYGGLLGIIGQQGKNPLFLVKHFKIKTAILFLSFFWSKITIFW
jgi:hypothetical protein